MDSQLGGLVGVVGGRERRMVNVHLQVVCLELMTHRSRAHHFTTRPHTIHIIMHIPYSRVIRRISPISAYPLLGGGFCS